jgi:predicted ribosomally synthesized peptide with SipW-like signal peptide
MRKIGLLVMALVLAMGTLGIGYAAWTDTITIDGTVNTGTVDIVIKEVSSTFVYKVEDEPGEDADEMVIVHQRKNLRGGGGLTWSVVNVPAIPANGILVASANATCPEDDKITITIDNAFPLPDGELRADFLLHYDGTIPVKVQVSDLGFQDNDGDGHSIADDVVIKYYEWDEATQTQGDPIAAWTAGEQLHQCRYILVVVSCDLCEQDDLDMGQSGVINGSIEVIQWNEWEDPTPP